jgi:hypothetical protein
MRARDSCLKIAADGVSKPILAFRHAICTQNIYISALVLCREMAARELFLMCFEVWLNLGKKSLFF